MVVWRDDWESMMDGEMEWKGWDVVSFRIYLISAESIRTLFSFMVVCFSIMSSSNYKTKTTILIFTLSFHFQFNLMHPHH